MYRALHAVLICYAFGLRADSLFNLEFDDITTKMVPAVELKTVVLQKMQTVSKNDNRRSFTEPRELPPTQFTDMLARLHECFLVMKRDMYTYRMIDSPDMTGDVMKASNFIPVERFEDNKLSFESREALQKHLNRVPADQIHPKGKLFHLQAETFTQGADYYVTRWLRLALKDAGVLFEARLGENTLTSHVIRQGAASAFLACNKTLIKIAKWLFGWKLDSEVPEENYIAWSWTKISHPTCAFFFSGWE